MDMFYAFVVICELGSPCSPSTPDLKFPTVAQCTVEAKTKFETEYVTQPGYPPFIARGGKVHYGCAKKPVDWNWSKDTSEDIQKVVKEVIGAKS